MAMVLAAIGDSWRDASGNNTTPDRILENGDYDAGGIGPCAHFDNHFGWDVLYGAIWDVLHGGPGYITDLCKAEQILNSAPWDGPFYHEPSDKALGWATTRRFIDDPPTQNAGDPNFSGNYNGLDYMLLFNLYYLADKVASIPYYVPNTIPFVSDHFPYSTIVNGEQTCLGSIYDPAIISVPQAPIVVNNLTVGYMLPGCPFTLGDLTIYGGTDGVLINNATIEYNLHNFLVFCTSVCYPNQDLYLFNPTWYQRINGNNDNNNELPPYIMTDEFKQIAVPSVIISPNPNNGIFTLQLKENTQGELFIYNPIGTLIYQSSIVNQQSTIDLSSRPRGIYFLKVQSGEKIYTAKIILQ
jgi:hypothetical protein